MQHSLVLQATTSDPNKSSLDGRDGEEEEEEEKVKAKTKRREKEKEEKVEAIRKEKATRK